MMELGIWILTVLATAATIAAPLLVPAIRDVVGQYVAGFVQHRFNEQIERLKSDLRQSEAKFSAELRANEQRVKTLSDAALSLRSTRHAALEARRLQAVERLWAGKVSSDRWRMAAVLVSSLNLEELYTAADSDDAEVREFAAMLDKASGTDLKKDVLEASAASEQPFLPPHVWALFSAYQGVMIHSVMHLKIISIGSSKWVKKKDVLKPAMLAALPEYKDYIEKYGFSGYYHLLQVLEQKLLVAIAEMLEGREFDEVAVKRNAEIMAAVQDMSVEQKPEIPESLRGPKIPEPPKI